MEQISIYLEKFKSRTFEKQIKKESIIEVIVSFFKGRVKKEDISIKDGVLKINAHPVVKSELFINKNKLIREIEEKTQMKVSKVF